MRTSTSGRIPAVCGIAFTVFAIASVAIVPSPPDADATGVDIRAFLDEHRTALRWGTVLMAIATTALVVFFAYVIGLVHRTTGDATITGTVAIGASFVIGAAYLGVALQAALVNFVNATADDATVRSLYAVQMFVALSGPSLAITPLLVAVAVAAWRHGSFPRWQAVVAMASAVLGVVGLTADLLTDGSSISWLGFIGFLLANVWIVGLSITTLTRGAHRTVTAQATSLAS